MSIGKLTSVQETCVFWTRPSFTLGATSHQHCIEVRARRWCAPTSDDVDYRRRMGTPLVTRQEVPFGWVTRGKGKLQPVSQRKDQEQQEDGGLGAGPVRTCSQVAVLGARRA